MTYFTQDFIQVKHEHDRLKRLYAHRSYQTSQLLWTGIRTAHFKLPLPLHELCVCVYERGEAEQWSSLNSQAASGGGGWANSSSRLQSTALTPTHTNRHTHTHPNPPPFLAENSNNPVAEGSLTQSRVCGPVELWSMCTLNLFSSFELNFSSA